MGRLFLVRHAQASFLSQDYDQLSARGETQARLLGSYWARRKVIFDCVCAGPCVRHRQTAELVAEAYRKAGRDFPSSLVLDEFDEFQGDAVLSKSLPELLGNNDRIRELHSALEDSTDEASKRANFQRLFQAVISLWVHGGMALQGVESWQDFCARVNRGLSAFLGKAKKGERGVIFTSGGPVSVAVQRALHLSAQHTLEIAWMPRNCSLTEFLFSGDRFTLSAFNSFPHLEDESLLTHR